MCALLQDVADLSGSGRQLRAAEQRHLLHDFELELVNGSVHYTYSATGTFTYYISF